MIEEFKKQLPTHYFGKKITDWKSLKPEDRVLEGDHFWCDWRIFKLDCISQDTDRTAAQYFGDNLAEYGPPQRPMFKKKLG